MNMLPTSNLLLKHQPELFDRILNKKLTPVQIVELLGLGVVGLAAFGGVMSAVLPNWWHTVNLMWKMIVLIVGSDLLCLPALYVFSSIRGSRLTLVQLVLFVIASIATTAVVLLSLSPIAWFFTWSTGGNIDTIRIMNTLMIGFGIIFGIILLMRAFQAGYKHYKEHYPDNKSAADILLLWLLLVIVVTVQMGQKLGSWYHLENQTCQFDICFPIEAKGQLVTTPTIQGSTVTWATSDCANAAHDVAYVIDEQLYTVGGNCTLVDGRQQCTAALLGFDTQPRGTELRLQTHDDCGTLQTAVSPMVTYVKP